MYKICASSFMSAAKIANLCGFYKNLRTSNALFVEITRHLSIIGEQTDEDGGCSSLTWASSPRPPSYIYGECTKGISLTYTTVSQELDRAVELYADKEAIVFCDQRIRKTFAEYKKDIDRLAAGLLDLDFQRGDRLAIWCPNRYEWVLSQFAAAKMDLILTCLNPAYQPSELEDCLNKVGARGLITADKFKTQDFYKHLTTIAPEVLRGEPGKIKSEKLPSLEKIIMISAEKFPGTFSFEDIVNGTNSTQEKRQQMEDIRNRQNPDDTIMISFTSGTTSKPKAIKMSHFNIINGCHIESNTLDFNNKTLEHRLCVISPLFHVIASLGGSLNAMINGLCTVYPSAGFNPGLTLKAIQEEKCTSVTATPTMFIDMMRHPDFDKTDFSSMRNGVMGGASCPSELIKAVATKMNCPGITLGYGSTEVCGAVLIHHQDTKMKDKLDSDGRIYDFIEAKILDDEERVVPMGTPGEICIRGYKVMNGYWNDDKKTGEVIKNRWYHTGDIGIMKENKTIKIVDRKSDMIIRGGENISPREIEEFLFEHPKIQEVHVIGVPDERMGEEICACIKLKDGETLGEDEIRRRCQGKIAHYKIPRYVRFVKNFPRTPTGKVQKVLMRKEMAAALSKKTT